MTPHPNGADAVGAGRRGGDPPSGYVAPPRLITTADVPNGDVFDPAGGYRANYSRIWGR